MRACAVAKKFKNNKQEKKKRKKRKTTLALREIKCAYNEKNDLSLELNKAILEAFRISELWELNILGP